ncbi:probable LRR receptor-like serine/threonine-protein kinase At3g47570 isoform X4 [Diospyros lotus]|uniref:probable LRR receptor-like serine/threonine-protein kinase At3g47570 isoform X4 n=1 Tax=Diospyros lotus TaxID=55363 RepID=UPI00224D98A3|nr:probable LRR receptor-like serine/threonine-protein kinase At3g47570 isoform X4 [Diospyros lotus]
MEKTSFNIAALVLLVVNHSMFCLAMTNLTTDQSALIAFKTHIISSHHPHNLLADNWSTSSSVCDWIGVSCGIGIGQQERVTALNLSEMGLTGTLSPQLGNLSFLTLLDLSFNSFHGSIPAELGHLHQLKEINLGNNNFSGGLPSWFGALPQLQNLLLPNNSFTGNIPTSLCNISKLETLNIGDLQDLRLSHNEFNGSIPREIGNLTMLNELYIGYNNLEGEIPSEIGQLVNLEKMSLYSASLTGHIPSVIFNISSLKRIYLGNNSLSGNLPLDRHCDLPFLEVLYLHSNQLSGQFSPGLWECRSLRILALSTNNFAGSISNKIGNLTLLRELYLGENKLTGALPEEIGTLNLETLSISSASLTGSIPFQIFNASRAKVIDLADNQLSGYLPSFLGLRLPNLEKLYLDRNKLSGIIPGSIGNASKLTMLEMRDNSFRGSIPDTVGNLRLLDCLDLSENNLTRESSTLELRFFTSLANCRRLKHLVISLNQFNGIIPASIGNLSTSLLELEAFGCKLMGEIPSGIGNLSSLGFIRLDSNELTGFIPRTIGRLQHLQRLHLDHNKLEGFIPNDFCRLNNLGELFLSDNKLYGQIPPCLGELKSLRQIYLDSNNLTSAIPSTLWGLKDLVGLSLSSNSLSGYIPLDVEHMKVITELDLSWNQLSGNIPSTIGGAQTLEILSLAQNNLRGPIPESLGNLINLEFLDLSNNNLSGGIPTSLEALRYLQYLNVSFNRLQGKIPTGGLFANSTAQSFMHNYGLCGAPRLQVPPCKTRSLQYRILQVLKYVLPVLASIILVVSVLILVWLRNRKVKTQSQTPEDSRPAEWRVVSYQELYRATNGFGESSLLGNGGFGRVYEGTLLNGMNVAIKVFNLQIEGAFKSFDAECEVMCKIRHRNLVKIITSCSNVDFKALVLENMPKGSLQKWLYSGTCFLDFLQRLNIMIDIALAVEYLHHGLSTPIIHCDLKPSNVLLDEDMVAHVSDFGTGKLLGKGEYMALTKTLATVGYMAPEYGTEGMVSTSGDVYSYGVMLMEVFTRKKPTDEMFAEEMSLKSWVNQSLNGGSMLEAMDASLIEQEDPHLSAKELCVSSVMQLAMDCVKDLPRERINMKDVVATLHKIRLGFLSNVREGNTL